MDKKKNTYWGDSIKYSLIMIKKTCPVHFFLFIIMRICAEVTKVCGLPVFGRVIDYCSVVEFDLKGAIVVAIPFFALLAGGIVFGLVTSHLTFLIEEKMDLAYERETIKNIDSLPMSIVDSSGGKNLIDEVKNAKEFVTTLPFTMVELVAMLFSFCVAVGYMSSFSIIFTGIYIVFTIPGILINAYWGRKAEEFRHQKAPDVRKFCYYRWLLTDPWPAKDVRVYDLAEPLKNRYDEEKNSYRKENVKLDIVKLKYALGAEIIMRSGEVAFTVYVISQAYKNIISVGEVTMLLGFATTLFYSFRGFFAKVIMSRISAEERFKYVTVLERMKEKEVVNDAHIEEFEELSFEDVSFMYPFSEEYTLHNISFTVRKGELLSIIGANGAGKSTIIKLMVGLYKPTEGVIKINGRPMGEYRTEEVHKIFSVLFQNYSKYSLNIRENVALSKIEQKDCDTEIVAALKKGMVWEDLVKKGCDLSSELTRQFDDNGTELSIGQWQKIALSRMWFKDAEVMILDEPSASLDAEAEDFVFNSFLEMHQKSTGIMISHRISSAQLSSKIIVINEGRLIEQGTHNELLTYGGKYAEMYNLQKKKYIEEGETDEKNI